MNKLPTTLHLILFFSLSASAAVPLRWTVETSRVQPASFEAYQGETLELEATLQSNGKPLALSGIAALYWQTNGMGSAYWEATAAVNSNRLSAVFTPEMDVGARVYNCFIGVPGSIYHAAFQLRLRPSPGAEPNTLPLPVPVIDFAKVRVLNPPWGSGGGGVDSNAVEQIANVAVVTNALTVATTNRVAALETATNNLTSSVSGLQSSKLDKNSADGKGVIEWEDDGWLNIKNKPLNIGQGSALYVGANILDSFNWFIVSPVTVFETGGFTFHKGNLMKFSDHGGSESTEYETIDERIARLAPPPAPSPVLRTYDEVRQCWWIGKMVNGVINWEVE